MEKRPSVRPNPNAQPNARLRLLFIGNSFTARNDLPSLIAALAATIGTHVEHRMINVGGASLRTHWNKGDAQKMIHHGGFDYVVLQEQSTLSVKNAARMHENIRLFDPVIKEWGARTVLYMTWARKHEPGNQATITAAYSTIGRDLGAIVVPLGGAWQRFLKALNQPVLHDRDGSHPTMACSFLAAVLFIATLLGRSPVGTKLSVPGLTTAQIQLLLRGVGHTAGRTGRAG